MSSPTRTDGGTGDGDGQAFELWDRVGRKAAATELETACRGSEAAVEGLTVEMMFQGKDPSPEQVRVARQALNEFRRTLEEYVAPAAGCEGWGDPLPEMPHGRYREVSGCLDDNSKEETDK